MAIIGWIDMGNRFEKALLLIIIVSLIASLFAVPLGGTNEGTGTRADMDISPDDRPAFGSLFIVNSTLLIPLTNHTVIAIDSDAEFASMATSEGWDGNGTAAEPYIIERYAINATGYAAAIYIGNTTVSFIVRTCSVHGADTASSFGIHFTRCYGILLNNVTNGVLDEIRCYDSSFGIFMFCSDNNVVSNSTVYDNANDDITTHDSDGNIISNNICRDTKYCICLDDQSDRNVVSNNTCQDNKYGVYAQVATNNTIENNLLINNTNGIYMDDGSDDNVISGNNASDNDVGMYVGNTVKRIVTDDNIFFNSSYGIYLQTGSNNLTISDNELVENYYGMMADSNSMDNLFSGNDLDGNYIGIILTTGCEDSTLSGNTFVHNYFGMYLMTGSDGNVISGNTFDDGILGIFLETTNDVTITANTFDNCSSSVEAHSTERAIISDNHCMDSNYGLYLYGSSNCTISGNTVEGMSEEGIMLIGSCDNTLRGNTVSGCAISISIEDGSDRNQILDDGCSDNTYGIKVTDSDHSTISGCTLTHNDYCVYLDADVDYCTITNDTIEDSYHGISIWSADHNVMDGNLITNCGDGVHMESGSKENTISNSTIHGCYCGIYATGSYYVYIENNSFVGNTFGMVMDSSSDMVINDNMVMESVCYGVDMSGCSDALIFGNTFVDNNGATDAYDSGHVQAYDDGTNDWNASTYGNYWSDWTTPDNDSDGIVDVAYTIDGGSSADRLPMTTSEQYTAPQMGSISGILADSDNQTLANVTVVLSDGRSTVTDAYGCFSFANVTAGTYVVTFAKVSYSTVNQNATVVDDGTEDMGTIEMSLELTDADIEDASDDGSFIAYAALGVVVLVAIAAIVLMYFRMRPSK